MVGAGGREHSSVARAPAESPKSVLPKAAQAALSALAYWACCANAALRALWRATASRRVKGSEQMSATPSPSLSKA